MKILRFIKEMLNKLKKKQMKNELIKILNIRFNQMKNNYMKKNNWKIQK